MHARLSRRRRFLPDGSDAAVLAKPPLSDSKEGFTAAVKRLLEAGADPIAAEFENGRCVTRWLVQPPGAPGCDT